MPYWFDGNNLIGQPASKAREDPQTRLAFLSLLSDFSASRGGRFLVFFDGDDPDRRIPPRGVEVRYSAPLSTDDEILRRIERTRAPSDIIVVTNDHNLRVRCRDAGTKALTWQEFISRSKTKLHPRSQVRGREEPVKMEEWLQYFGLDRESLE